MVVGTPALTGRATTIVLLLLLAGFAVPTAGAQEGHGEARPTGDPRLARIAIVLENESGDPAAQALLEAAAAVITSYPDAYWFQLTRFDAAGARRVQAEVIGRLAVNARAGVSEGEDAWEAALRFHAVPRAGGVDDPLAEAAITVNLDRGGRYQRKETWKAFLDAVEQVAADARPVASVRITSSVPITLGGLPHWLEEEVRPLPARQRELTLRTLRGYELRSEAPGYRQESILFYLEHEPLEITVAPRKYPRHTLSFIARGVSWPGVEYAWYDRTTRWMVHAGVTTFAWGLTPLRQMGTSDSGGDLSAPKARLVSSHSLTEFELGGGYLAGDRDSAGRWLFSGSGVLRVTHVDDQWSVDPVIPAAVRLGAGRERELPRRMILTQRLATDLYWPVETSFLRETAWAYRLGPLLWQLPIYRVGVRVVL